jgi:AraC-like DNA-binding protein
MPGTLVRSAILTGAAEKIRGFGRQPGAIARRAGIPSVALKDPDVLVPGRAVLRFFELAAETCGNRNWGLELAAHARIAAILGPLWILLRNARSVGQMCQDLATNFDLYSSAALMNFEIAGGDGLLSWSAAVGQTESEVQMAEFALAIFLKEIRVHGPPNWTPKAVCFRHRPPEDLRLHRKVFGANLQFNSDANAIHMDAAQLDRPVQGSAPHARGLIRDVLRHDEDLVDTGTPMRVEAIVRALLPFAPCTIRDVSRAMGLSPRTLQEHLQLAGTSFRSIKDAVRSDLAVKYLQHSQMSATQIADILGYADITSFSRSFRRWHGRPLRSLRSKQPAG